MKIAARVVALLAALALLMLLAPSMTPLAIGEEAAAYPVYTPVTLAAQEVTPIPYTEKTPYARFDPSYVESGYRQSTQNIITSDGSYDQQRTVQSWGYSPYGGWGGYYGFGAPFYGPYGYAPLGYPATSQTPFR